MAQPTPYRSLLCENESRIESAGFQQIYQQSKDTPARLAWWECAACGGWFVDPPPSAAMIESQWPIVVYGDAAREEAYAQCRCEFVKRLINELSKRSSPGKLLDVGCGSGAFLGEATAAGWQCRGLDPNRALVEIARSRGLDVRQAWTIDECGFHAEEFQVITLIDVFYYSWHPHADLQALYRYLRPGGVLMMRLANKRFILGMMRRLSREGPARNKRLSRYLQGQFHSISISSLARILRQIGFSGVQAIPHAMTAPASELSWQGRAWYFATDLLNCVTLGRLNLSPGIFLCARKN